MALGPIHCGSFLLLAATVLLVIATGTSSLPPSVSETDHSVVSAPVVHSISFLNIHNGGQTTSFGVFGYCRNIGVCILDSLIKMMLMKMSEREWRLLQPDARLQCRQYLWGYLFVQLRQYVVGDAVESPHPPPHRGG